MSWCPLWPLPGEYLGLDALTATSPTSHCCQDSFVNCRGHRWSLSQAAPCPSPRPQWLVSSSLMKIACSGHTPGRVPVNLLSPYLCPCDFLCPQSNEEAGPVRGPCSHGARCTVVKGLSRITVGVSASKDEMRHGQTVIGYRR